MDYFIKQIITTQHLIGDKQQLCNKERRETIYSYLYSYLGRYHFEIFTSSLLWTRTTFLTFLWHKQVYRTQICARYNLTWKRIHIVYFGIYLFFFQTRLSLHYCRVLSHSRLCTLGKICVCSPAAALPTAVTSHWTC